MESALIAFGTAIVTSLIVFWSQERRLRAEMRTQFMAEAALRRLLQTKEWDKRSFDQIKRRFGEAFSDRDLRQLLVRAGAVRFEKKEDGGELWGLVSRNESDL